MRYNPPSGYEAFPKSVRLWASITHPGEAMSMLLYERVAESLVQEKKDGRLPAYLAAGTKIVEADFPVDGEVFRAILNGDAVDLAPPYVPNPARGWIVFRDTDVIKAAEIARIFPSVRVPLDEAIVWIATGDREVLAAFRRRASGAPGSDIAADLTPQVELMSAIEAGEIAIFGRPLDGEYLRPVQPIPAAQWRGTSGLRIHPGSPAPQFSDTLYASSTPLGGVVFYDLEVCRSALLTMFPPDQGHDQRGKNQSPSAATGLGEPRSDRTPVEWPSAAAWYRAEGRKAAEDKLKADGSRLTEGRIQRAASDVWNAMPCNKNRKVNPGAFKKADKRALKKGTQGAQKRGAGDTF